jgi:hypothetical protein
MHIASSLLLASTVDCRINRGEVCVGQGVMGRSNDGGALALLLIFCSLDAIQRLPGGYIISGVVSCGLLIVGIIWMIIWVANVDTTAMPPPPLPPGAMYASPPPPGVYLSGAKSEKAPHTPQETNDTEWWTNFFLISAFLILLTTPACWYMPSWGRPRVTYVPVRTLQPVQPTPNTPVPVVQGVPVPTPSAAPSERPLLALRTDCLSTDHV